MRPIIKNSTTDSHFVLVMNTVEHVMMTLMKRFNDSTLGDGGGRGQQQQ